MEIKLFSLYNQESVAAQAGRKCIYHCVKSFFRDCEDFEEFSSQKRMLLAISQSLRAADIVLVAVQSNMYNATKKLLSSAMDLKNEENTEVSAVLKESLKKKKIKDSTYKSNVTFPVGADILPTNSYMNCGFVLTSGGQHIIYLPIDGPKAHEVVFGSLYDYFSELVDPQTASIAFAYRHRAIIARTVEKLRRSSVKVAMANINGTEFIKAHTKNKEKFDECFVFENKYNKHENEKINDILCQTSREVKEAKHADFGVLISKPYTDSENELFMYIAISDSTGTRTMKVYAQEGEIAADLTAVCVDKLMLSLYDFNKISGKEPEPQQKVNSSVQKTLTVIVSSVVGVSAIVGLVLAFVLK